jgi:bacillithiol biosynthesis deacetylase BshB1
MSGYDLLAVGAHPDDADLGVGGLLAKSAARGLRVAMLDLTRGELASRGTPDERQEEAARAAGILGVAHRVNACLPDGGLANVDEQRLAVIRHIRALRPRVLLLPGRPDRHPDHEAAHELVRAANFFAGLARIDTGQEPWRAPTVYFYHPYYQAADSPALLVDISDHFDIKLAALAAYASQFHNPSRDEPETYVSSARFWEDIRTRAAFWGSQAGVRYAEPLHHAGPLGVDWPPGLG